MVVLILLVLLLYLINHITLKYGYINLDYTLETDTKAYEIGESIQIYASIENRKWLTVPFLKIKEVLPEGITSQYTNYTVYILPQQRVKIGYEVKGTRRGLHTIRETTTELGDFFGFKSIKARIEQNNTIRVKPAPFSLKNQMVFIGSLNGEISIEKHLLADPILIMGIREYTGQEPQKYIHWPSTAKYGNLMVKQFDYTTDQKVMLLLNCESEKPHWGPLEYDIVEKSISIARATLELLEELNIPYAFSTNAHYRGHDHKDHIEVGYGKGKHHLDHIMDQLIGIDYRLSGFFESKLKQVIETKGHYTTVVIITPRILESYIEPINLLAKHSTQTLLLSQEEHLLHHLHPKIIKYREVKDD